MKTPANNNSLPLLSIALVSALSLAYEILLMKLFSIIQWHHFAYMMISIALLGYGASGTFLAITGKYIQRHFSTAYVINLALFGLSSLACYLFAQQLPFNPELILWDISQPIILLLIYLLLTVPFFFAATAIGLTLSHFHHSISKVYSADLFGAGVGSITLVALLFVVFPNRALQIVSAMGFLTAAIGAWEVKIKSRRWGIVLVLISVLPFALPVRWTELKVSPYKSLSQILQITGAQVIDERSSPLGMISVVKSPRIPFRHAPGLSLNATTEPPEQIGLFTDAGNMTVLNRYSEDLERYGYLDQLTSALPYHLKVPQKVLILGAGGGAEVLQARFHQSVQIDAVELNPQIIDLVNNSYGDFTGRLYQQKGINIYTGEARGFVARSDKQYDLIQLALLDSFGASSAGLYALSESYLYTVEALREYIEHLGEKGILSITRWVKLPPRDTLKLFATAVTALEDMGNHNSGDSLVLIRGWQTSTLLIKNGAFNAREIDLIKNFCKTRSFDLAYYPGIQEGETNQFNILRRPYFYDASQALLGKAGNEREKFLQNYKFNLQPATDDRPYFFHFFKWQILPEILSLRGQGGMPLIEWGYLILVATFIQAVLASLVLIMLPLALPRWRQETAQKISRPWLAVYFVSLGLGFIFIEIAFIQKFILFLHHPLYATAVVLASFLFFAGLGSRYSERYGKNEFYYRGIKKAVINIFAICLLYIIILGKLFSALIFLPAIIKIFISVLLIAPLAFYMGMPFPLCLSRLGKFAPTFIPWVWGVNGCASVISAILATLLAIHFGFTYVVIAAVFLYGIAAIGFRRIWPGAGTTNRAEPGAE